MDNPVGAIRYAIRQFRLSPVFTASAVLTLSLGIGGTTAIFTLIHAVMLRSLPVADPERLYRVGDGDNCCVQGGPQDRWGMFSYPLFERLKAEAPEFEQLTAFQAGGFRVSVRRPGVDVAARSLRTEYVTGNYFTTFGIGAFGGRVFTADDDTPASPPVVVISHHSWEAMYGGDPSLVGQTLVIEGHPFTVAGVAPPGFFGDTLRNNPPDLWIPIQHEPMVTGANSLLRQPVSAWLRVIGRLKPGATTDAVAPRLTNVLRQWIPRDSGWPANWLSDVDHLLPKQRIAIVPAGTGVGVMKEQYASSLQLLMAVCGLVLLIACANVANLLLARSVARRTQTAVRMAIGASRSQIVTQALVESLLLAIAGGIAGLVVAINRPSADYTVPRLTAMYRALEDRLNRIPGVQSTNLALYNPLTDNWGELILVAGHPPPKPGDNAGASWDRVSAHYLQNLGTTMARGRTFTEADNETTAPVAIVNEAFVKRLFKSDEDPIGQHFGLDEPQNVGTFTIVGVVRDARWQSFQFRLPPRPMFYVPLAQKVNYVNSVMTRVEYQSHFISGLMLVTKLGPGALEPLVTKAMADVDPSLTFMNARTLEQQIALTFDQERAVASLAGLFGGVSLLLAAIGLYGVTAYSVAQRTNEI